MSALQDALKDSSEEERRRILAQFEDDMHNANAKLNEQRNSQRDILNAKLAARKRMREELEKEKAVRDEVNRITAVQAARGDTDMGEIITTISKQLTDAEESSQQRALQEQQIMTQVSYASFFQRYIVEKGLSYFAQILYTAMMWGALHY